MTDWAAEFEEAPWGRGGVSTYRSAVIGAAAIVGMGSRALPAGKGEPDWGAEFTVCRCEGPLPEPIQLNGRTCCGRCHKPIVEAK